MADTNSRFSIDIPNIYLYIVGAWRFHVYLQLFSN